MERHTQHASINSRGRRSARYALTILAAFLAMLIFGVAAASACTSTSTSNSPVKLTSTRSNGAFLKGTIVSLGTTSIILSSENNLSWTVEVTPATTYEEASQSTLLSALTPGEIVQVSGSVTSGSVDTFAATNVRVVLVHVDGTVVSTTSGSFVVQDRDGTWRVVVPSSATTYSIGPKHSASSVNASNIVPGIQVEVSGLVDANHTSIDAVSVHIDLAKVSGTVTAVTGTTLSISSEGIAVSVTTSPSTVFQGPSGALSLSAVVVGASVTAWGTNLGGGTFSAQYVTVPAQRRTHATSTSSGTHEGSHRGNRHHGHHGA